MIICIAILAVLALAILLERLVGGTHIESLMYNKPLKVGDKVHIYLDGVYNRTATITSIEPYRLFIYDKLPLHIAFRGRFYAKGLTADGRHLVYVGNRNHYKYVRLAELLRIFFAISNNSYMLEPTVTGEPIGSDIEQKEEVEE